MVENPLVKETAKLTLNQIINTLNYVSTSLDKMGDDNEAAYMSAAYVIDIEVNPTKHIGPVSLQIFTTGQLDDRPLRVKSSWGGSCGLIGNITKIGTWVASWITFNLWGIHTLLTLSQSVFYGIEVRSIAKEVC
ncbi:MAG: hypothetical protein ACI9FJ_000196 [Alteromonadaceae bacterium]